MQLLQIFSSEFSSGIVFEPHDGHDGAKLGINFGNIKIIDKGQLHPNYQEIEVAEYMREEKIDLNVNLNIGTKNFTAYTMDLTKKYIEINADYRS